MRARGNKNGFTSLFHDTITQAPWQRKASTTFQRAIYFFDSNYYSLLFVLPYFRFFSVGLPNREKNCLTELNRSEHLSAIFLSMLSISFSSKRFVFWMSNKWTRIAFQESVRATFCACVWGNDILWGDFVHAMPYHAKLNDMVWPISSKLFTSSIATCIFKEYWTHNNATNDVCMRLLHKMHGYAHCTPNVIAFQLVTMDTQCTNRRHMLSNSSSCSC